MKWNPTTRRHFLQGAGKTALTLPFLPSLLPEKVAQAQAANRQKSFIGVPLFHGFPGSKKLFSTNVGSPSAYMPIFNNMQQVKPAVGHAINVKSLEAAKTDGGGQLSELFDSAFNPYLSKMLMLNGLDFFFGPESHQGAGFGNTARGNPGQYPILPPAQATIDQVMAHSTNFYKNPALLGESYCWTGNSRERNGYGITFSYSDPKNKATCAIDQKTAGVSPQSLWDDYFSDFMAQPPPVPTGPTLRQKLVDSALVDYKALRTSPRLGGADRLRLNRHIDLLNDTQKSLSSVNQVMASCNAAPARPGMGGTDIGYSGRKQSLAAFNNVIASLISCGLCHSFTSHFHSLLSDDPEKWHAWAHSDAREHTDQTSAILHDVVADLVGKLDSNGLLDDALVMIPMENSVGSHKAHGLPVVMIGGAGGSLKTGQYVDYRNITSPYGNDTDKPRPGYSMTQALANILMAMDVPPSEFEPLNRQSGQAPFNPHFKISSGYGHTRFEPYYWSWASAYSSFKGADLSAWLPLIKA